MTAEPSTVGREHWTHKGDVRLFLWEKARGRPRPGRAAPFCSCTARRWPRSRRSTCRCRAGRTPRRWTASSRLGYDTWCVDMEGYGRSDKASRHQRRHRQRRRRPRGGDRLHPARARGVESFLMYGISSGALRAALFAERHPERVRRLAPRRVRVDGAGEPHPGRPAQAAAGVSEPRTAARSTGPSCGASSPVIIPGRPTTRRSRRSPTRSWPWTTRCRPAPTWTCARTCRSSTRRRSRCRRSSCAASTTASRASRTSSSSSRGCRTRTSSSPSCPASPTPASSRRTTGSRYHILHSFFSQPAPVYRGA